MTLSLGKSLVFSCSYQCDSENYVISRYCGTCPWPRYSQALGRRITIQGQVKLCGKTLLNKQTNTISPMFIVNYMKTKVLVTFLSLLKYSDKSNTRLLGMVIHLKFLEGYSTSWWGRHSSNRWESLVNRSKKLAVHIVNVSGSKMWTRSVSVDKKASRLSLLTHFLHLVNVLLPS